MVPMENPRTSASPHQGEHASKHPDGRRMVKVLSDERRRQMILEAFGPEANISKIAREYGINRNTLHEHINRAVRDAEGQWREAEAEASFRRKIWELTRQVRTVRSWRPIRCLRAAIETAYRLGPYSTQEAASLYAAPRHVETYLRPQGGAIGRFRPRPDEAMRDTANGLRRITLLRRWVNRIQASPR